jgi:hypothetical protein
MAKQKKKKTKIILPSPKNLALALFMHKLPEIIDIWERETNKEIPFDQWLMSIYENHQESNA